jgi:rubrerythrin
MPDLKGTLTFDNLLRVFGEEAVASRRVAFFARIAEMEGFADASKALGELSDAEMGYADGHLDFLRREGDPATGLPIGDTTQNLLTVARFEAESAEETYVALAATARGEGFYDIAAWFEALAHTKRAHLDRLSEAREALVRNGGR